ncbi:MAG: restriction endonuclease subunit S [Lachnospiraceae bacterium]|nr:restriction endonuclease subunit S [Lachnospiraceae bacterium]
MAREMKDSGIEWIGEIPRNWKIKKLKYVSLFRQEKYDEVYGNLAYVGLENVQGWSGTYIETDSIYDKSQSLIFQENDILWGKLRPYLAKVYHCTKMGCCSSEFCVMSIDKINDSRFFWYLLISSTFVDTVNRSTYGTKMPRANVDFIKNMYVPIPSAIEQSLISGFLDNKNKELDNILSKTRASIEEYKKLKQAVITQAVTKGIRGDREMKDSENKWVREIPSDIKISRVGLHYEIILGKMLCTNQIDATYTYEPYFCAADVHFEGIAESERKKMWFSPLDKQQYLVRKDDLLVVEGGAGAGGCTVASMQKVPTYIQNSIMIVRPRKSADVRYLKYLIECLVKQGYIDVSCNKATIPHFTKDKLANVPFLVFSLQEQKEIAQYLDKKCNDIDAIISYKENYIMEIENYKKSLIYEYVTGKKEVPQKYQV